MLNAFIFSEEVSKATVCFFMIEIHRMRVAHAHLMVCELFYKPSLVFEPWYDFCHPIILERLTK